jgi:hypothetical protein
VTVIYVDESGDLGWTFTAPYRAGGSSRHLTLAAVLISSEKKHYVKRQIKLLQQKFKILKTDEIKWALLSHDDKITVAHEFLALKNKLGDDMLLMSMTVKKEKVLPHIRKDPNKLYNFMMKCLLCEEMSKRAVVTLIPDPRSIKVESGNSMHDYLQTQLWFELNAATQLSTNPLDSKCCNGLQLADLLSGIVQSNFEDSKSLPYNILSTNKAITHKKLFF